MRILQGPPHQILFSKIIQKIISISVNLFLAWYCYYYLIFAYSRNENILFNYSKNSIWCGRPCISTKLATYVDFRSNLVQISNFKKCNHSTSRYSKTFNNNWSKYSDFCPNDNIWSLDSKKNYTSIMNANSCESNLESEWQILTSINDIVYSYPTYFGKSNRTKILQKLKVNFPNIMKKFMENFQKMMTGRGWGIRLGFRSDWEAKISI